MKKIIAVSKHNTNVKFQFAENPIRPDEFSSVTVIVRFNMIGDPQKNEEIGISLYKYRRFPSQFAYLNQLLNIVSELCQCKYKTPMLYEQGGNTYARFYIDNPHAVDIRILKQGIIRGLKDADFVYSSRF